MPRPVDRISRPQSSTVLPTGRSYDFREPGCRPLLFVRGIPARVNRRGRRSHGVFRPVRTISFDGGIFEFARQTQTYFAFGGNRVYKDMSGACATRLACKIYAAATSFSFLLLFFFFSFFLRTFKHAFPKPEIEIAPNGPWIIL